MKKLDRSNQSNIRLEEEKGGEGENTAARTIQTTSKMSAVCQKEFKLRVYEAMNLDL